MPKHRHSLAGKYTSETNVSVPSYPADALTAAEVSAIKILIAGGGGGTTPIPNPPQVPPPDITAPVISGIAVSGITTTTATITWTTNEAATGVVVYGTTTGYGSTTSATASGTSHSRTLTGLTPGQTYQYEVRATDTAGNIGLSGNRSLTTTAAPTLPGAPTGLTATGGNTQVTLNWVAPASNGGSAITGYRVYRNGASLIVLGVVTTYLNTGLTNGLTYTYTVAAITAVGEGPQSNTAAATPNAGGDINPPVPINIVATVTGQTTATISWSQLEAGTGQVRYGISTAYGSTTTLEPSFLTGHSQNITGLTAGTLYHFQVVTQDAAGNTGLSSDRTFTTQGATPPVSTGVYGPGIAFETKSNERLDGNKSSMRFRATQTSTVTHVSINQRFGAGYSLGTGGTVRISIQTDSGGIPSGTILASHTFSPGNPGGDSENRSVYALASPPSLTAGILYHLVVENTHASPAANYISVNVVLAWNPADTPRQPAFSDDFAVHRNGNLQNGYIPVFDIRYANGSHDGSMYYEIIIVNEALIGGTSNMARARFTVSGGTRTVSHAYVQVRRNSGSGALVVRLEQSDGTLIESVSVAAAVIPIVAAGAILSAVGWTAVPFTVNRTLTNGSTYNLRLSCAAGTQYSVMPLRWMDASNVPSYMDGGDWDGYHFEDGAGSSGGSAQKTTDGTNWVDLYAFDPTDFGFYFRVV